MLVFLWVQEPTDLWRICCLLMSFLTCSLVKFLAHLNTVEETLKLHHEEKKKKRWQDQVKTNSNYSWTWLACTHSPRTQTWAEGTSKEEMHKQHLRKAKHHQEHCINSCVFLQKIRLQSSVLLLRYYGYLIKFFHLSFYSLEAIKPQ